MTLGKYRGNSSNGSDTKISRRYGFTGLDTGSRPTSPDHYGLCRHVAPAVNHATALQRERVESEAVEDYWQAPATQ